MMVPTKVSCHSVWEVFASTLSFLHKLWGSRVCSDYCPPINPVLHRHLLHLFEITVEYIVVLGRRCLHKGGELSFEPRFKVNSLLYAVTSHRGSVSVHRIRAGNSKVPGFDSPVSHPPLAKSRIYRNSGWLRLGQCVLDELFDSTTCPSG